jgi:CRISPR-associated protein Cas6
LPASSGLHKTDWLAIELISGFPSGPGLITLSSSQNSKLGTRNSKLSLRIPADHYRDVLPLAGKRLDIGGHQIRLGLPVARSLEPAPSLYARVVTIKKFTEPDPFLEAVNRQLDSLGVKGRVELPRDVAQTVSLRSDNSELETQNSKPNAVPRYRRRIVTIHGKSVVGFSVAGSARHFAKILKSSSLTTNPQYYALTLFSHRTQSPIGISEIDSSHTIPHLSAQHLSVSAATPYISTSVSSTAHHLTPHMIFIDKESYSNIPCPTYDRHFQCWVCNGARTLKHNRGVQGSNRRAVAGYLMRRWDDLSYL